MKLTRYQLSLPDAETWEMNVTFKDKQYPGVVTEIKEDDWASIIYMHPCVSNFKWPVKGYCALTHINAMLCKVHVKMTNGCLQTGANSKIIDDFIHVIQKSI